MAYRPAVAFVLATGRGTRWRERRRRGLRRAYGLAAVGPGAVDDGRGDVGTEKEAGTVGRRAFAPAVAGRLAVAREEGGEGPLPTA